MGTVYLPFLKTQVEFERTGDMATHETLKLPYFVEQRFGQTQADFFVSPSFVPTARASPAGQDGNLGHYNLKPVIDEIDYTLLEALATHHDGEFLIDSLLDYFLDRGYHGGNDDVQHFVTDGDFRLWVYLGPLHESSYT
jgi:hypothetical protein